VVARAFERLGGSAIRTIVVDARSGVAERGQDARRRFARSRPKMRQVVFERLEGMLASRPKPGVGEPGLVEEPGFEISRHRQFGLVMDAKPFSSVAGWFMRSGDTECSPPMRSGVCFHEGTQASDT